MFVRETLCMSLQEFMSVTSCQEFVSGTCQIKYEPMGHRKPRQRIRDDNHGPGPRAWSVKTVAKQYWDEVFYARKFAGLTGRVFARLGLLRDGPKRSSGDDDSSSGDDDSSFSDDDSSSGDIPRDGPRMPIYSAVRVWAGILKTTVRAGQARCDSLDD
ncbi:hypothetical protein YC2023_077198 [Brassica napus]